MNITFYFARCSYNEKMHIILDTETAAIFTKVEQIISPTYLVGGSVRSCLLGVQPNDYDFTTPLDPDTIEDRVKAAGLRAFVIGKRFGTIGFKLDGHFIEVTTFRKERYIPGSRRPYVEFIEDITHDLSRRDFTINAMAVSSDGRLIDPFGGHKDLKAKRLRTVNKPYERYNEDPLRMLRAARFISQLSFDIDYESELQAGKKAHKILEVSKERWTAELDKLLLGSSADKGLDFLMRTTLLRYMIPELAIQLGFDQNSPYHELDLWSHTLKTVRLTPNDSLILRYGALLHDIGKPYVQVKNKRGYSNYVHHELVGTELVAKIGPYLHWPAKRTAAVQELVLYHLEPESPLHAADSGAQTTD